MRRALCFAIALVASVTACKRAPSGAGSAASAQAPGRSPAAPAKPKPKPKPWYVGRWSGSYDAAQHTIDMTAKQGAVHEWKADPGKLASGKGTIAVEVDDVGAIHGSSNGALGELIASGEADADALRIRLEPAKAATAAFRGLVVAKRNGDAASGKLSASSGDSLTVREAPVTLHKAP